jgi:chemotaxis protein methyltransferase CheR
VAVTTSVLAELIERVTGLALDRGGVSATLDRVVAERQRVLGLPRIEDYIARASDPAGVEQRLLIDAITVPHTWFYRDLEQLQIIGHLLRAAPPGKLAVWVAGCATGEEAYTLAMIGRGVGRDVSVLATDVNEAALAAARRGVYTAGAVRDVPDLDRRWLVPSNKGFAIDDAVREQVSFLRHNLVDPPPLSPRGGWDLVVCRNVLIYFSSLAAVNVLDRFARAVREGGWVVVGASEVVFEPPRGLELVASGNRLVLRRPTHAQLAAPPRITGQFPVVLLPRPVMAAATRAPSPRAPVPDPAIGPERDLVHRLARGHLLFERGELQRAIPIYAELTSSYPAVAETWLFLGIARYAHGETEPAVQALRASLCLDPALWPANFYLARAFERLGRRFDAMQQYDLIAVDNLRSLALLSESAVINELRAFRHDFWTAARRAAGERPATGRASTSSELAGRAAEAAAPAGKPPRSPTGS